MRHCFPWWQVSAHVIISLPLKLRMWAPLLFRQRRKRSPFRRPIILSMPRASGFWSPHEGTISLPEPLQYGLLFIATLFRLHIPPAPLPPPAPISRLGNCWPSSPAREQPPPTPWSGQCHRALRSLCWCASPLEGWKSKLFAIFLSPSCPIAIAQETDGEGRKRGSRVRKQVGRQGAWQLRHKEHCSLPGAFA